VSLLKALDQTAINGDKLRQVLQSLFSASDLFRDQTRWEELVDLLREREANELAEILRADGYDNSWASLKETQRSRARLEQILEYFGLEVPDVVPRVNIPSLEDAVPDYALFDHQLKASSKVEEELRGDGRKVVLHMPTGSGKTRTAMHVIARHLTSVSGKIVVWLANSEELCEQAFEEFQKAWRSLGNRSIKVARYWGGHAIDLDNIEEGMVVGGISKLYQRIQQDDGTAFFSQLAQTTSLVVMDEAHQAVAPTYKNLLTILTSRRDGPGLLGLTATPGRTWEDLERDQELADFFDKRKVRLEVDGYDNPVEYLIEEGYLARTTVRQLNSESGLELSETDLKKLESSLDIPSQILEKLGKNEQRNLRIVHEVETLADNHRRILVFASSVASAELLAMVLEAHGRIRAKVVTSSTNPEQRSIDIAWFREDTEESRVLCNYGVLTTGFDAPRTSAAVIARPTKSVVLYNQMVGRATRGVKAGGNETAEVVTVVDTALAGFTGMQDTFSHWEDVW